MDIHKISQDINDALQKICNHYTFIKNKPGRPAKYDEKIALIKKVGNKAVAVSQNPQEFDSIIKAEPNSSFIAIVIDYYGDICRLTAVEEPRPSSTKVVQQLKTLKKTFLVNA